MNEPPRRISRATGSNALRFLRRPRVVVTEIVLVAVAVAGTVALPQQPDDQAVARFAARWPNVGRVTSALGFHEITTSWWFVGTVLLALASLLLVQWEQWRRVARQRRAPLAASSFAGAQYLRELLPEHAKALPEAPRFRTTGSLGVLGSPLFHLGVVIVVAAGLWRSLTFSEAAVRALEGATVDPTPDAWEAKRAGLLAQPFATETPLQLVELLPQWYPSGTLRQLEARIAIGPETETLAINRPADVGGGAVYLTQAWGVASLVEIRTRTGAERRVVYLDAHEQLARGTLQLPGGLEARLKARVGVERPDRVEVRIVRGRTLVAVEELPVDASLDLGEVSIRLAGLRYWAQYRGSRDPSEGLFLAGVAVAVIGITLMMTVVRVDTAVFVKGGRVVVALNAQRFAPLYAERFEQLCREWTR